jgi:hypothetical protein
MSRLVLGLWQNDCPQTGASADQYLPFTTLDWNCSPDSHRGELWVEFSSADRSELEALDALGEAGSIQPFERLRRLDSWAVRQLRSRRS